MVMRKFDKLGVYINFENFTDTRQYRMEDFIIDNHIKPSFPDLWAPIDGLVINAGLLLEL